MAHLTTNLMASDTHINVYCEEIGAHLRISTGGVSNKRFIIQVMDDNDGDLAEEFVTSEYHLHPDSVEVEVSYDLTVTANRRITLEFENAEDYQLYKDDPECYIRENGGIELYSTSDAIDDADFYEIEYADIKEVEEM